MICGKWSEPSAHIKNRYTWGRNGFDGDALGVISEPQTPELADLPARMEGLAWHVAAVEDTLPLLDKEDLQFLELRYFQLEPMPVWQITEQMYISRSELYRRRERLVRMFARRFGYEI